MNKEVEFAYIQIALHDLTSGVSCLIQCTAVVFTCSHDRGPCVWPLVSFLKAC